MGAAVPAPGDVIAGKLVVEKVLGIGGMGVVVAARHRDLGERVAVKMLRLARDGGASFERMRREARAAARLRGEHVARVMDIGALDDGSPYIVMEYVSGRTIARVRESEGRIAVATAVDWVLQACEGLAEAHALGIVHRDIKPSNLLLSSRPDGAPLVKLLDFGIAKSLGAAPTTLTETGGFLGSPLYASPEQVRDAREVDHRSDIWSIGVVLYELVTGRLPFPSFTATAALASLVADPPVPPRGVVPELPEALERALLRCLEKNPTARFADVSELARAIEPFGSEAAAGAAERVLRILRAEGRAPPSAPPPAPGAEASTTVASHDEALAASRTATEMRRSSGRSAAPPPPSRARWWLAAAPLLGLIALLGLRTGGGAPPTAAPELAAAPRPAATPPPTPAPEPAPPAPGPPPGVTAAARASAAPARAAARVAPPARSTQSAAATPTPTPGGVDVDFGPRK